MNHIYKLLAICLLLPLFQSNATISNERPKPKSNALKPLDCGITAPTIVNYGCLDVLWSKNYKRLDDRSFVQFAENPTKVYKTPDGGYIFASASQFNPSNSGSTDLWVVKVDANGVKVWNKIFGTTSGDSYTSFVKTLDGGYLLGGSNTGGVGGSKTSGNKGGQDAWVIKIDANGNKLWDKSFGGIYDDFLATIITTSDNGFLLGISSDSPQGVDKSENTNGGQDAWVIKIDANGNKVWDKNFGGSQTESVRALSETSDGYLLGANSDSGISGSKSVASKGGYDMWVLKMDFDGNKIWDNVYGGSGADAIKTINKDSDGSFLIGGTSNSPIGGDKTVKSRGGFTDIWLVKVSASGSKLWDRTIGGNQYETLTSVTTTSTGSFIVNLKSDSPVSGDKNQNPGLGTNNPYDLWLFEINSSGTKLWEKIMLGSSQTQSGDLLVDGSNLIVLGGPVNGETPQTDFWIAGLRKISYCQPQNITSTTICQKQCTVLTANDCASGVVKWSNGQYGASICASPNATQNYKAVCLSVDSTCVGDSSAVFTVNVNAVDNLTISPAGYTAITCGQSQTITATGCTNGVIHWTGGLTGNSITVTPVKDRAYKATCTTPNGCTTDSLSAWFTVNRFSVPSPYIENTFAKGRTVCAGNSTTLQGNNLGGASGWTGGTQGSTLTVTPTSNVTIKYFASQANGCSFPSDSDYVNITVVPAVLKPIIANYNNCLKKVWDKRFGGSQDDNLIKTIKLSDGYLLVGHSNSSISGDKSENNRGIARDYWIVKTDNNGNKIWDKTYGGTGDDILTDAVKLLDGGFVLVGQSDSGIGGDKTEASKGLSDYWIVKIDVNGNKVWDKTYGGDSYDQGVHVRETNDGLLIGGTSLSSISGNKMVAMSPLSYHFWILKLDSQGNKIWEKQFGGTNSSQNLTALEIGNSNEYLLLGHSGASANTGNKTSANKGGPDYWLVKIDANGDKIWDKSYGGSSADYPYSMVVSNDGKVTMLGTTGSSVQNNSDVSRRIDTNSNTDIWLLQVDADGNKIWNKTFGTSGSDNSRSITLTSQGKYIISGYVSQNSYKSYDLSQDLYGLQYSDYWIIELDANGNKLWDKSFGGFLPDFVSNVIEENNNLLISGNSLSGTGGDKSQPSRGESDYWLVKMNTCQPNISNSITICKNDTTLLTAQGCPNASTVKWSNNEYVQTISVKPSFTTTYKAICISTDAGVCQSDSSIAFTVNVNIIPPPSITATSTNLCVGEGTTLTASGCEGTYGWTGGATTTSITVSPIATKTFKVACTFNGCTSDSTSTIITVNALPTRPIITTPSQNICVGGNLILTASGCNSGIYQWTGGLTGSSITVSPANTTTIYKVACKVSNCVSDSSLAVTITTVAKPATPTIIPPTNTTICRGISISLTASACSGGTLGWTGGLSGQTINISPNTTKNYKVACNVSGCVSDSSSVMAITVNPKPAQPTINQSSINVCAGISTTLTVTAISGISYAWTGGLTGSSITVSPVVTKTYKIAGTINGCTSDSSSIIITVQGSSASSPITTNATVCEGGTLITGNGLKSTVPNCSGGGSNSVTATYLGGTVGYDGGSSSGSNPTATISGMSSTITKVRVSITWQKKGGGNATSCGTAHNGGNPYHGETSFRLQGPDGTTLNLINANTYSGSTTNTVTTVFEDGFSIVTSGVPPVSGTFSPAFALSVFNGKIPNGVWTLLPNDNGSTDPLCVSGFAVSVTAGSVAVPSTITWWNAQTSGSQVGTGSEYLPITNTFATGTYTYHAQASCTGLCPSPRVATTLTVSSRPATPTITPPTNSTICRGNSITLSATGCTGGTYAWTGGLTGTSISINPSVTRAYKVACTLNTCVSDSSSAVTINVTPSPIFTLNSNKTSVCSGDTAILTVTGCTGTISWSNGATNLIIKVSPISNTTYIATCSIGACSSNQSVTITPLTAPNVTSSGILQCGQTATLTANNFPNGSSIQWRKDGVDVVNATNNTVVINSAGSYDFTSYKVESPVFVGTSSFNESVKFINETTGFVGNNEGISKTDDGGVTWIKVYNSSRSVKCISFINSMVGWAVGNQGLVIKTIDGGNNWTLGSITTPYALYKVVFKDSNNGLIVGDFGSIFTTSNGGNTWIAINTFNIALYPTFTSTTFVPNTLTIWSVGAQHPNGFIAKSVDNGLNWSQVAVPVFNDKGFGVSAKLNDIVFTTSNNGWVVADDGLYRTTDGGTTWQTQSTGVVSVLAAIQFVNSQVGFIVGNNNTTLLKTVDGGNTWKSLNTFAYANSLSFVSDKLGWMTYNSTVVKYSTPQCSTTPLTITQTQRPSAPTITPPANSTICQGSNITLSATGCTGGTFAWTGGLTGTSISISPLSTKTYKVACTLNTCTSDSSSAVTINVNPTPVFSLSSNKTSICSGDTATLIVLGCTGTISWSNGTTTSIIKVSPVTNTTYTATCTLGSCSSNQSVSITVLSTPTVTASNILQCGQSVTLTANNVPVGANIQWQKDGVAITNATNSTLVINNGGNYDFYSYVLQYNNNVGSLTFGKCVIFINETTGFVGNNQGIFKTTDGGINWFLVHNAGRSVNSITFLTSLIGFAVGEQGFVYKTINGGNTWSSSPIARTASAVFEKIKFKDSSNGIIVGGIAEIYYTNDGGVNWQQSSGIFLPNPAYFKGVSFVPNSSIAYAVGSTNIGRVILKSIDNGVSWSEVTTTNPISSLSSLNDISFTTSNDGLLVGTNGTIYKTIDGGLNWQQQTSGTTNMLLSLQYVNNQVAYICGSTTLLKTFDGGNTWKSLSMTAYPVSLSFVNESTGWLTNYGSIIKYNAPQCSTISKVMNNINCSDIETIKSGSWTDPTTWSANRVPTATDDVIINIGHTVNDTGGTIRAKSLNYRGGILQISSVTNLILGN